MKLVTQRNEILTKYGLDFQIEKLPMQAMYNDTLVKSDYYGLLNTKTMEILNNVKEGYRVSQTDEVVDLVLKGLRGFDNLEVVMGGALHGGRKVFLQIAIEGDALIGDDRVKRYITVLDSNDGSSSLSIGIGDFTMSCSNQFFHFYKQGEARFRHSASMDVKILEIPTLIEYALTESMRMANLYKDFQSTKVSRDLSHSMVNNLLGIDLVSTTKKEFNEMTGRKLSNMNNLYSNINHEMIEKGDNLWGLMSGVTRWTTHFKQAPKRDLGRVEGIMTGTNYKTNHLALDFCKNQLQLS